jgi:Fe-S-cluster containining protein
VATPTLPHTHGELRATGVSIVCFAEAPPMSDDDQNAGGEWHPLRLHFRLSGADRHIDLSVPVGPRRLVELLPVARQLSDGLTAAVLDIERAAGRESSCRSGCGSCCRQLVAISYVEAQGLAELVAALPAERQAVVRGRFASAVQTLEQADLLNAAEPRGSRYLQGRNVGSAEASARDLSRRYFALQIPCPFLEAESCGIYEARPSICREHHVTTPAERCQTVFDSDVTPIPTPQRIGDLLMNAAHRADGLPRGKMPLTLSLEWSEANGERLAKAHDGMTLFSMMMGEGSPSAPGEPLAE